MVSKNGSKIDVMMLMGFQGSSTLVILALSARQYGIISLSTSVMQVS